MELLEQIVQTALGSPWMLLIVLAVCILDAIMPPVPSESVVVAAAVFASAAGEYWLLVGIAGIAAVGAWIGDNSVFRLGRLVGTDRWEWMRRRRVSAALSAARRGLDRRGALVIFTGRFIPLGRVAVDLTAGATGYPARRFAFTSAGAAILWAAYSVTIGVAFGHWLGDQPLLAALLGIVTAVLLGLLIDRMLHFFGIGVAAPSDPEPASEGFEQDAVADVRHRA